LNPRFANPSNLPFWNRYPNHQCDSNTKHTEYLDCIDSYIENATGDISTILTKQSEAIEDAVKINNKYKADNIKSPNKNKLLLEKNEKTSNK